MTETSQSFLPIIGASPKVLILGTLPGKVSLSQNQYYANTRNIFWKLIYTIFETNMELDYLMRIEFLKKNDISIWDVCHQALRESSLDSDIKNEVPNDLSSFLEKHSTINIIAFNGKKAEKLYEKHFDCLPDKKYLTLLSTSPRNTSYSFEAKLSDWKRIICNQ